MIDNELITVLTYNIHKGFSPLSRRYVINKIRDAIRGVGADIVFLQEILGFHPYKAGDQEYLENQFEFLADQIWHHYAYGKNAVYSEGHHGNAILCKFPIINWENINISTNRLEKRGLLHVTVQKPGWEKPIHLFNVHLDLREVGRLHQIHRLIGRADSHVPPGEPLIVAGDFNDWPESLTEYLYESHGLQEVYLKCHGQHPKTYPRWSPFLSLDRVYSRGLQIVSAEILKDRPWNSLSDHLPLKVELRLTA